MSSRWGFFSLFCYLCCLDLSFLAHGAYAVNHWPSDFPPLWGICDDLLDCCVLTRDTIPSVEKKIAVDMRNTDKKMCEHVLATPL